MLLFLLAMYMTLCSAAVPAPTLPATFDTTRPVVLRTVGPVADGAALQAAINAAVDGDEILLNPGTTYTTTRTPGGFILPPRGGTSGWVIIRTNVNYPATDRVTRNLNLAKLQYAGTSPEFSFTLSVRDEDPRANYWMGWRFELVEFVGVNTQRRIIALSNRRTFADGTPAPTMPLPSGFVFDRVWIHPNQATDENSFGMVAQVFRLALLNSICEEIHAGTVLSQESKCFGSIEGGIFVIDNNFLSAGSIGILMGGADPLNPAWGPADLTVTRNYFFKPLSWFNGPWFTIKNHFELKSGRRVLFEANICENSWPDQNANPGQGKQHGYAWMFWSVGNPSETSHLTLRNNIIKNTVRAFSVTSSSGVGAVPMHDILVDNLLVEDGTIGDTLLQTTRTVSIAGGITNMRMQKASLMNQPNEYCFWTFNTAGPTGHVFEGDSILCPQKDNTYGGLGQKPLSDTWASITFTNSFAINEDCTRYTTGWTCGPTPPAGVGADMAAINAATGSRTGVITGIWTQATTATTARTTTAAPATTAPTTTVATTTPATASTTTAPTTTASTAAPTTTVVAGTTTSPSPLTTTTSAATTLLSSSSALTTTSAGATTIVTSGSAGATTAAMPPPQTTSPCPRTCCTFGPFPFPAGYDQFSVRLNLDFANFDCANFKPILVRDFGLTDPNQLTFSTCVSGSVVLTGGAPSAAVSTFMQNVASGTVSQPVISATAQGRTATPPSAFPWWIIVVAVIGGLVLIALIVIVVIVVRRRRSNNGGYGRTSSALSYVSLETNDMSSSSTSPRVRSSVSTSSSSLAQFVTLHVTADVTDVGETILPARRGDIAFATPQDWSQGGEWLWVKIGTNQGYIPRSYCRQ